MSNSKEKFIFLMSSISQPRCIKRINSFIKKGYEVEIYGYDRNIYNLNAIIEGNKINILEKVPSGKLYFYKFFILIKSLRKVFKKFKNQNVIFYSFSFDISLIILLFSNYKYIYEISDIIYSNFSNFKLLFRVIDRYVILKSRLTVLTSKGFQDYLKINKLKNILVQPNRVDSRLKTQNVEIKIPDQNEIIFSFVGALRYKDTIFRFAKIIGEKFHNHKFYFWGDSSMVALAKQYSEKYTNVKYMGPFKSPEDLKTIYHQIDLIVACYDTRLMNTRIAEPNKFYESIKYKTPIIVSKNTYLESRVEEFGTGFSIDCSNDSEIINFINCLNEEVIKNKIHNICEIKPEEYVDDDSDKIFKKLVNV